MKECAAAVPMDVDAGCGVEIGEANHLRRHRVERMMSKAELARRAGVSSLTVDRIERGYTCRMDTKRKLLEALGFSPAERDRVFPEAT